MREMEEITVNSEMFSDKGVYIPLRLQGVTGRSIQDVDSNSILVEVQDYNVHNLPQKKYTVILPIH